MKPTEPCGWKYNIDFIPFQENVKFGRTTKISQGEERKGKKGEGRKRKKKESKWLLMPRCPEETQSAVSPVFSRDSEYTDREVDKESLC